uniref:Uncharacterized protein n=1 Tax=Sphaerodactylus townsendi TaxID=933632 RepID=A0ACB8EER1_9SAUR
MGSGLIPLEILLVLMGAPLVPGTERRPQAPAPHFLYQMKSECRFANGTAGEVRLLVRHIYNRQEFVRFDSRRGTFEAVTELGEPDAAYLNGQKELLEYRRAQVDDFCRYNWGVLGGFFDGRKKDNKPYISDLFSIA